MQIVLSINIFLYESWTNVPVEFDTTYFNLFGTLMSSINNLLGFSKAFMTTILGKCTRVCWRENYGLKG